MANAPRPSISRKLATLSAVLVATVAVLGVGLAYLVAHPGLGQFCTVAGYGGGPFTEDPQEAFDAWWATSRPTLDQDDGDIDREGTTWHVDKGKPGWTKVEVERADDSFDWDPAAGEDPDQWAVVGANRCGYADA